MTTILDQTTEATKAAQAAQRPATATVEAAVAKVKGDEKARLVGQERAAADLGISLNTTFFPVGTKLIAAGVDKARMLQASIDSKPRTVAALEGLRDRVVAERRKDIIVPASTLYFDAKTGTLKRRNGVDKPGVPVTRRALQQLCSLLPWHPDGAGQYLGSVNPEERAWNWDKIVARSCNAGYPVMLRFRRPDPSKADLVELYAVCSEKYTACDPDVAAATLIKACESHPRLRDAACEVIYQGTRTKINIIDRSDVAPADLRVGDILHGTASLGLDDAKGGSVETLIALLRALCVNLTTGESVGGRISLRHTGDAGRLLNELTANILRALDGVDAILRPWKAAEQNQLAADEVIAVVKRLTAAEEGQRKAAAVIQVPGVSGASLLDWIVEAYNLEPLPSQLGVAHAVARAPQVGSFPDAADAYEILSAASGAVIAMPAKRFNSYKN